MAIKRVEKHNWPDLKKFLRRDGYLFVAEAIEQMWDREQSLHEMLEQMVKERNELAEELRKYKK